MLIQTQVTPKHQHHWVGNLFLVQPLKPTAVLPALSPDLREKIQDPNIAINPLSRWALGSMPLEPDVARPLLVIPSTVLSPPRKNPFEPLWY